MGPQSGQGMRQSGARAGRSTAQSSADRLSSQASIADTRIRRRLPSLTDAISFDAISSYSFVRPMPAMRAASDGETARRNSLRIGSAESVVIGGRPRIRLNAFMVFQIRIRIDR